MSEHAVRRVPCPRCAAPALFAAANRWRPFCSERCAGVDLGAWASEAYRVESGSHGAGAEPLPADTTDPPRL